MRLNSADLVGNGNPLLISCPLSRLDGDTEITQASLTGDTQVGFLPFILPPRTRVVAATVGRISGGNALPTSAATASIKFQFYSGDRTLWLPTTRIGGEMRSVLAGDGSVAINTRPPYWGFAVNTAWYATCPISETVANHSFRDPRLVYMGVQLQGGGAFTALNMTSQLRTPWGPALVRLADVPQPWSFVFPQNPGVTGMGGSDLACRPQTVLTLESI